jgi:hypothetical protein
MSDCRLQRRFGFGYNDANGGGVGLYIKVRRTSHIIMTF